jgi:hypothetical protein
LWEAEAENDSGPRLTEVSQGPDLGVKPAAPSGR